MPARKRRPGVSAPERVFVERETQQLHAAAERARALLDRLGRTREEAAADRSTDAAPVQPRGVRKGWWPFGRKTDAAADRAAELKAELEAVVKGRPQASIETAKSSAEKTESARRKASAA